MTNLKDARDAVRAYQRILVEGNSPDEPSKDILYTLDQIFNAKSDRTNLLYDDFRRKFEVSKEFLSIFKKAYETSVGKNDPDARQRLVKRCASLTAVLGDLIWLIHRGIDSRPIVTLQVDSVASEHVDNRDNQARVCVAITQAAIQKCRLVVQKNERYLLVADDYDEHWGWTDEPLYANGKFLWIKPHLRKEENRYNSLDRSTPFSLDSYVGYPLFYEDDRAQIVAVYGRDAAHGGAREISCLYINGYSPNASEKSGASGYDYRDSEWFRRFSDLDDDVKKDKKVVDGFAIFAEEAVIPYQTRFKTDFLNRRFFASKGEFCVADVSLNSADLSVPTAAISVSFAVPVEPLDDAENPASGVEALFAYLTAEIAVAEGKELDLKTLQHLSEYIWNSISYFQEPMLRLLVTEQNAKLKKQHDELVRTEFVFNLIRDPLNKVAAALTTVQANVNTLHGIFQYPFRGLYMRAYQLRHFFHTGELTLFGQTICVTHNPATLKHENYARDKGLERKGINPEEYLLRAIVHAYMGLPYKKNQRKSKTLLDALALLGEAKKADRAVNQLLIGIISEKKLLTGESRPRENDGSLKHLGNIYAELKYVFLRAFKPLDEVRGIPLGMLGYALPMLDFKDWEEEDGWFGESDAAELKRGKWLMVNTRNLPFSSVADFIEILCKLVCLNGADGRGEGSQITKTMDGFRVNRTSGEGQPRPFLKHEEGTPAQWATSAWRQWLDIQRDSARGDFADLMSHLFERALQAGTLGFKFDDPKIDFEGNLVLNWMSLDVRRDNTAFRLLIGENNISVYFGA